MGTGDERFERLCLEEYKALRAESLRCAGIIANTVWLGITQFAITIVAAASFGKDNVVIRFTFLVLLSVESLAASAMFLSELWKYARIGRYIREKIEKTYIEKEDDPSVKTKPMFWENWIKHKRARLLYHISIIILQLPNIIIGITLLVFLFPTTTKWLSLFDILYCLGPFASSWQIILWAIILTDGIILYSMKERIDGEGTLDLES